MKYLVTGLFAVALLASPAAMAAHHVKHGWNHGWNNHYGHNHHWRAHERFGNWRDFAWFDWRVHHLRDPGHYHWVFYDGQYLLIDDRGFVVEIGGGGDY